MKKRTLLTLASIYIACSGYAQQQVEPEKMARIQKNPTTYQNNGGIIDSDQMIAQPEKPQKVVDPEGKFVIYKSVEQEKVNGDQDYKMIKDQTSDEYIRMKADHLRNHPVIEPAEETAPRPAQQRNNLYNKK